MAFNGGAMLCMGLLLLISCSTTPVCGTGQVKIDLSKGSTKTSFDTPRFLGTSRAAFKLGGHIAFDKPEPGCAPKNVRWIAPEFGTDEKFTIAVKHSRMVAGGVTLDSLKASPGGDTGDLPLSPSGEFDLPKTSMKLSTPKRTIQAVGCTLKTSTNWCKDVPESYFTQAVGKLQVDPKSRKYKLTMTYKVEAPLGTLLPGPFYNMKGCNSMAISMSLCNTVTGKY